MFICIAADLLSTSAFGFSTRSDMAAGSQSLRACALTGNFAGDGGGEAGKTEEEGRRCGSSRVFGRGREGGGASLKTRTGRSGSLMGREFVGLGQELQPVM
jgi:hypothetical protein